MCVGNTVLCMPVLCTVYYFVVLYVQCKLYVITEFSLGCCKTVSMTVLLVCRRWYPREFAGAPKKQLTHRYIIQHCMCMYCTWCDVSTTMQG